MPMDGGLPLTRQSTGVGHVMDMFAVTQARLLCITKRCLCNKNSIAQVNKHCYYRNVLGKERFTGTSDDQLNQYPIDHHLGKAIRQSDAIKLQQAMEKVEGEVKRREALAEQCSNRIDRITEIHRLNMDYLISFGIWAEDREQLTQILKEVEQHGGLSLEQATALANARAQHERQTIENASQISNGLSFGGSLVS